MEKQDGYPTYPSGNQRYACNLKKTKGVSVSYTSDKGYTGPDTFNLNVIFSNGLERTTPYRVVVQ